MVKASDILENNSSSISLPDGKEGRKGSIAATLKNIALFEEELRKGTVSAQFLSAIEDQKSLLPVLKGVGLMELFSIEEWLQDQNKLGRIFLTLLYIEAYPEEITPFIRNKLENLTGNQFLKNYATELIS